jgi:V/A-type H+-transporting ATPase subunit G/H
MEDILKRLLAVESEAEARVQQADEARRRMIQEALDAARRAEAEFEQQAEARRQPFLATAEEGARRRIEEMEAAAVARQRTLRELAARNEPLAVERALALILGRHD